MIKNTLAISALALGMALPVGSFAQATMDHGKMGMSQPASMTDGEVKMVFTAKDKAMLAAVKAGDKVKFMVVSEGGKMVLTEIQPAK
jgi:Cu(I)/Ag(I) efflux system periplasmic protein CusF